FVSAAAGEANFSSANILNCEFRDAALTSAKFYQADVRGSSFGRASLSWCDFREASLAGADFCRATLCSARFGDANLFTADLREANLQGAREITSDQLSKARTSSGTTLPNGRRGVYLKGSGSERAGIR